MSIARVPRSACGFSLIELALVLLVVSILLSGALLPLTNAIEQAKISQAHQQLDDIRLGLLGYAASRAAAYGTYLPCPDCRFSDCPGGIPNDGIEDLNGGVCSVGADLGNLPWASLGIAAQDPWASRYSYVVLPSFSNRGVPFSLLAPDLTVTSATEFSVVDEAGAYLIKGQGAGAEGAVALVFSHGKNRFQARSIHASSAVPGYDQPDPGSALFDEQENLDRDLVYVSRPITYADQSLQEFDDVVMWLSAQQVRGFLVQAGRL